MCACRASLGSFFAFVDVAAVEAVPENDFVSLEDLVFFNINNRRGGRASHVGVYLKNDLFVHATTKQGVIISSLNEPYYRRTYIGGGRVL